MFYTATNVRKKQPTIIIKCLSWATKCLFDDFHAKDQNSTGRRITIPPNHVQNFFNVVSYVAIGCLVSSKHSFSLCAQWMGTLPEKRFIIKFMGQEDPGSKMRSLTVYRCLAQSLRIWWRITHLTILILFLISDLFLSCSSACIFAFDLMNQHFQILIFSLNSWAKETLDSWGVFMIDGPSVP